MDEATREAGIRLADSVEVHHEGPYLVGQADPGLPGGFIHGAPVYRMGPFVRSHQAEELG